MITQESLLQRSLHETLAEVRIRMDTEGESAAIIMTRDILNDSDREAAKQIQAAVDTAAVRIIRDRIELTREFIESLNLSNLPAKSTVAFIAREVVTRSTGGFFSSDVTFVNQNVVIIADRLDTRAGSIVMMTDVITPQEPVVGASPGDLSIFCRDLLGCTVLSVSGNGGRGKSGKRGADGAKICEFDPEVHHVFCHFEPGKDGGDGGNGAKGGNSGRISVSYLNDLVPGGFTGLGLINLPGLGGPGGFGGRGGKGDPNGKNGKPGQPGPSGDTIPPTVTKFGDATAYSKLVLGLLGSSLATWRERRLRAAEYYFRAFRPEPGKSHYLTLARDEAQAVLMLSPTSAESLRASSILSELQQQFNVLGLSRDAAPLFIDFPRHNKILLDYENAMRANFRDAVGGLLEVQVTQDTARIVLDLQRKHLESNLLKEQIKHEISAAEEGRKHAAELLGEVESQRIDLQKKIKDLEFRMSTTPPPGGITLATGAVLAFGAVASVAATLVASPVAGSTVASLIPMATDLLGNGATIKDLESSVKAAKDIAEVFKSKTDQAKANSKGLLDVIKDPKKFEADWKQPVANMVVSFTKLAIELSQAEAKGDPRYAELLNYKRELFVTLHQEFLARLKTRQAEFAKKAAEAAEALRVEDLGRVNQAMSQLNAQDERIRRGVLAAVVHARSIRDRLLWLVFNAARSLDLYTLGYPPGSQPSAYVDLRSPSTAVHYDWGFLHPDDEAAYLDRRMTHLEFQQRVRVAMAESESLRYSNAYTHYREKRSSRILSGAVLTYPRPDKPAEVQAALKSLKGSRRLFFSVSLTDLRPGRYEAKVTAIRLTLSGVKSPTSFGCLLRHHGRSQQRWLPTENATPPVVEQVLPLAIDPIEMKATGQAGVFSGATVLTQPGADPSLLLQSHGRGVAADWSLEIEPGSTGVDLTGLSGVKLEIEYDSFFVSSAAGETSLQSVSHVTGALMPGATSLASLQLAAPAPETGGVVRLTSSDPAIVEVPELIELRAGERVAAIPLKVMPAAVGKSATVTASADTSLSATLYVPAHARDVLDVSPTIKPGFIEWVSGIGRDDRFIYMTHFFSKEADPHESFAEGELLRLRHSDFKEEGPRVKVGFQPRSLAVNVNPTVNCVYVLNSGKESQSLTILDRSTLKEVAGSPLKLGQGVMAVAVNSRNNRVYVTSWGQHLIHVIEMVTPATKTHAVVAEIKAEADAPPLTGLHGLVIDEARDRLYAVRHFTSETEQVHAVAVIDGASLQVLNMITHPRLYLPVDVALNATGTRLYVAMLGDGTVAHRPGVTAFDVNPDTGDATFRAFVPTNSNAWAIAVNPRLDQIYVTFEGGVHVINERALTTETPSIVSTLLTGKFPQQVVVQDDTGHILVGDAREGTLTRLSVPELEVKTLWA